MLDLWDVGIKCPEDLGPALRSACDGDAPSDKDTADAVQYAIDAMTNRWGRDIALSMIWHAITEGDYGT